MYSDGGLWSVLPCSLGFVVYEFEISGVYFIFFLFSESENPASVVNAPAAARCSGPPRIEQVHPWASDGRARDGTHRGSSIIRLLQF